VQETKPRTALSLIFSATMLLLFHAPFLFGYAKPVPVNFRALHSPRRDMVLSRPPARPSGSCSSALDWAGYMMLIR
jgi:hypothetical protein